MYVIQIKIILEDNFLIFIRGLWFKPDMSGSAENVEVACGGLKP